MTKEAIKKLPTECRKRCEILSKIINDNKISPAYRNDYRLILNGYLCGLKDMNIINANEEKGLRIYYKDKKWGD